MGSPRSLVAQGNATRSQRRAQRAWCRVELQGTPRLPGDRNDRLVFRRAGAADDAGDAQDMRDPRSVWLRPLMTEKRLEEKEAHN